MTESIHTRPEEYHRDIIKLLSSPLTEITVIDNGEYIGVPLTEDYEYFLFVDSRAIYYPKGERGLKRYYWECIETNPMDKEIMEIISRYIILHEMQ